MKQQNNLVNEATSAIATASKTPFWTAFKITLGIGLAQLSLLIMFLAAATALVVTCVRVGQ